jgi:DNA-binding NarL/FixJ family response regulator
MKSILVIEDHPVMRQKTVSLLTLEGFEVHEAGDGHEGLQAARTQLPDLILCDIMLPGLDGYQVLEQLRAHPATATTPFLFLTARGARADLRAGMNLGADDYLVKPVTRVELLAAIQARLERQRLQEEAMRQQIAAVRFEPDFRSPAPLAEQLGLTDREAETLLWVAQGKSNADIATILGNSEKTVKKTLGHVFEKLGLESRTAAALRAVEVLSAPVSPSRSPETA